MKIIESIERLNLLHRMIQEECTGTPEEFASLLRLGKSQLYNVLEEMKSYNAPIRYSRKHSTFYYHSPYEFKIELKVKHH